MLSLYLHRQTRTLLCTCYVIGSSRTRVRHRGPYRWHYRHTCTHLIALGLLLRHYVYACAIPNLEPQRYVNVERGEVIEFLRYM